MVFADAAADLWGVLVSLQADLAGEKFRGQFLAVLFSDRALGDVGVPDYPRNILFAGHE